MDAQQFLAEFGHIVNAPGGVAKLRELVYQLAVTGRLTLQLEEDGTADVALSNIARIRQGLITEKKFKRSPKLESAPLTPPAIVIPPSWRWSRLLDLGEINPRNQVQADSESVVMATFVPMAAVSENHSEAIAGVVKPWAEISKGYTHFANGDVLLAKITPCFENGKSAVARGLEFDIGAGSTEFHVFRPISQDINPAYIYLFVRSPLFRAKGEASMTGTAGQKRLPTDYFALCAMPLPPTDEQSRIVAKVDELMALCDQLEAQQQQRRILQNQLRHATLQAVAASQSPHELQENWQRLEANFTQLLSAPEDVADLRRVVWDMAIRGFLSETMQEDIPAQTTFENLKRTEKTLVGEKLLGRPKSYPALLKTDEPFPLPDGWIWVRLGELAPAFQNGLSKRQGASGDDTVVLRLADITNFEIAINDPRKIRMTTSEREKYGLHQNDILITRVNGSAEIVGSFIKCNIDDVAYCDHFIRLRFLSEYINPDYITLAAQSPFFRAQISSKFVTTAGQKTVNQNHIGSIILPLPPIQEQKRILSKVENLLLFCSTLSSKYKKANNISKHLATASISTLTGIAIEQEEEPMKAPKTELVAPIRLGTPPDVKAQAPLATILARHNGEMSAKDLWQRFGGEIDAFYAQLKTEVAHGWLMEPTPAEMLEK